MLEVAVYVAVFVALSGLMAMVDAAVLSVTRAEVEDMLERQLPGSAALHAIVLRLPRAVVIIVLLTNTVNILGPILAGRKAVEVYGDTVIGIITAILTLATIVFSEIIPKSLGAHYAPLVSRLSAPAILALIYALFPLVNALAWLTRLFRSGERRAGTESQIRSLATIGRRAGYIEKDEGQLIHRAFIMNDKTAADVMTPLKDMVSLQSSMTLQQAKNQVLRHPYSRYPVVGKSLHDVQGTAMSRDILSALCEGRNNETVSTVMRPATTVSGETSAAQLLVRFRNQPVQMAVVQQDGRTVGLVTLEDVLEELVGDIAAEHEGTRGP